MDLSGVFYVVKNCQKCKLGKGGQTVGPIGTTFVTCLPRPVDMGMDITKEDTGEQFLGF